MSMYWMNAAKYKKTTVIAVLRLMRRRLRNEENWSPYGTGSRKTTPKTYCIVSSIRDTPYGESILALDYIRLAIGPEINGIFGVAGWNDAMTTTYGMVVEKIVAAISLAISDEDFRLVTWGKDPQK